MKRAISILLLAVMAFSLVACGQSLTAIAKLAPDATMGEGLSIHYSGGDTLGDDVAAWLETNKIVKD